MNRQLATGTHTVFEFECVKLKDILTAAINYAAIVRLYSIHDTKKGIKALQAVVVADKWEATHYIAGQQAINDALPQLERHGFIEVAYWKRHGEGGSYLRRLNDREML